MFSPLSQKRLEKGEGRPLLEGVLVGLAVLAVSFLSISFLERAALDAMEVQMRGMLIGSAELAASVVDGDTADSRPRLRSILGKSPSVRRLDLLIADGDSVRRQPVVPLSSQGTVCIAPTSAMLEAFHAGHSTAEDFGVERFRNRITGYAPLRSRDTIVGIDLDPTTFLRHYKIVRHRAWFAQGIMSVFAFLSGLFFWRSRSRRLRQDEEREASRKRLLVSEEMYRTLFETSGSAIAVYGHDCVIRMMNRIAEELFGWRREEVEGKRTWAEFVHPDEVAAMKASFQKRWNDPRRPSGQFECHLMHRDGTVRNCALSIASIPGSDLFVCSIIDRTRFIETSRQLEVSQQRYRVIFQEANTPILVFDAQDRVVVANGECLRLVRRGESELEGLRWTEFIHPDDLARIVALRKSYRSTTGPWRLTLRLVDDHGETHHTNFVISRLPGTSDCIAIGVDITERIQAEGALQKLNQDLDGIVRERTAELEKALRSREEFLSATSHELRTPLQAIQSAVEILQDRRLSPALDEGQARQVSAIERGSAYLLSLISDILDLAKSMSGEFVLRTEPTDCDAVCHEALDLVATAAAAKRVHLHYEGFATAAVLELDPLRLRQILINLLTNAIKFTPEGGDVWLEAETGRADGRLALRVRDNGIGISGEDQQRLFQPFVQLDNSLSRSHSGTGLGLALVRRLAEAHGGEAVLESRKGEGTTVTVLLPWKAATLPLSSQPESDSGPDSVPDGETARILLAEDNEDIRESIEEYLVALGCQVVVAENGAVALEKAATWLPDVILMDVQMPVMDGLEATRRLRADARTQGIPIVAMTAMAQSGDAKKCLAAGANTYLSKPVRLKDLLATVRSYAQG